MSVFNDLETSIITALKNKIKLSSIRKDQIIEVISMEQTMLKALIGTFKAYDSNTMNVLYKQYLAVPRTSNPNNTSVEFIIQSFASKFDSKAQQLEAKKHFGAIEATSAIYTKVLDDILKHIDELFETESITLYESKLSNVMILGMLREADIFVNYAGFLWTYFGNCISSRSTELIGYRKAYLINNYERFIKIINHTTSKTGAYRYLDEISSMRRKNADLILYANDNSFLNMLNTSAFNINHIFHLQFGIIGFNFFTHIVSYYDDWKHSKYLRTKDFEQQLVLEQARLKLALQGTDRDSPEYQRLTHLVELYDRKITDIDRDITDYEEGK